MEDDRFCEMENPWRVASAVFARFKAKCKIAQSLEQAEVKGRQKFVGNCQLNILKKIQLEAALVACKAPKCR
jgi:hypothetical protein